MAKAISFVPRCRRRFPLERESVRARACLPPGVVFAPVRTPRARAPASYGVAPSWVSPTLPGSRSVGETHDTPRRSGPAAPYPTPTARRSHSSRSDSSCPRCPSYAGSAFPSERQSVRARARLPPGVVFAQVRFRARPHNRAQAPASSGVAPSWVSPTLPGSRSVGKTHDTPVPAPQVEPAALTPPRSSAAASRRAATIPVPDARPRPTGTSRPAPRPAIPAGHAPTSRAG